MSDQHLDNARKQLEALIALARTNFPGNTNLQISVKGRTGGSMEIESYELSKLIAGEKT